MYDESTLYYMTPSENLPMIYFSGILCRTLIEKLPSASANIKSIDDKNVNFSRGRKVVFGRSLHDFVPLYWVTHTPMQHRITMSDKPFLTQDDLVFVVMKKSRIEELPGIVTTDGNAACNETKFFQGWEAMPYLDRNALNFTATSRIQKRLKSAEVLVYLRVPPTHFDHFIVRSESVRERLLKTFRQLNSCFFSPFPEEMLRVNRKYYYLTYEDLKKESK